MVDKFNAQQAALEARQRLENLRKKIELMVADDALQVYALASSIERIVDGGGQIGRIALALASSRITVKAAEEVQHAAEHAQDN